MRPWYRSLVFWFGLTGLIFLVWSWEWSAQKYTELRFPTTNYSFHIGNGSVEFTRFQPDPADGFGPSFDSWWTKRGEERGHFDFPAAFAENHDFAPQYRTWNVAIWLVVSLYGLLWLAALFTRHRIKRMAFPALIPPGES